MGDKIASKRLAPTPGQHDPGYTDVIADASTRSKIAATSAIR
jgi:hypothetical protein